MKKEEAREIAQILVNGTEEQKTLVRRRLSFATPVQKIWVSDFISLIKQEEKYEC